MTFLSLILSLFFLSFVRAHPKPAIKQSLQGIKQISADVFTCDSSDAVLNAVCQAGLRRINSELEAKGLSVDHNGVLFTFDNDKDRSINTGHSCSVTAQVTHQHASARISSSTRLKFSGGSLTEPFAIRLQLPVSVSARIDVKQRFGARILLGGCSNFGSDSYSFKASFSTTADVMVGISFKPSFGVLQSGDYALVIEPNLAVLTRLRNTDFKFRVSGVSPISAVLTFVTGVTSTFLKSATAIFTGDSILDIIKNSAAFDIGVPFVLGIGALPRPLEDAVFKRLLSVDKSIYTLEKRAMGFGADLEDKLQTDLRKSLRLNPNGKRTFIIKRDVVNLLRSVGVGANVFIEPPVDPSIKCREKEKEACRTTDLSKIYDECIPLGKMCSELRREHARKYEPSTMIPSKPKIADRPPAVTPRPQNMPDFACLAEADLLCQSCRGCNRCREMILSCG